MITINSISATRFTLNGIPYYKNYISKVAGNRVIIFNAYDFRDVLVEYTDFEDFTVNGSTFVSSQLLQNALISTLYTRAGTEGGATEFIELTDTPASYTGQAGKVVTVKDTEDGVEFTDPSAGAVGDLQAVTDNGSSTTNPIFVQDLNNKVSIFSDLIVSESISDSLSMTLFPSGLLYSDENAGFSISQSHETPTANREIIIPDESGTLATREWALQRDGSNANSDVDLGAFNLNAKGVKINGTAGHGHLGLKHQSTNATAGGQETVIFAGNDGEPRYKNDGGAIEQFASRAWVLAQGFLTSIANATASVAGIAKLYTSTGNNTDGSMTQKAVTDALDTKENTITAGTTGQYYRGDKTFQTLNVSAVSGLQTALDLKADRFLNVKVPTTSYLTGTTAETEVYRLELTGNTFSTIDILKLHRLVCQKVNANATFTIRVKLSTSATMPSGTTDQIALLTTTGGNQLYAPITRTFFITGGNIIGFPFNTSGVIDNNVTTAVSSAPFDRTVTQYLYVSVTLGNINDQVRIVGGQISNV